MTENDLRTLEAQVLHHRYLYYVVGKPVISDDAYDALEGLLKEHAPDSEALHSIGHADKTVNDDVPHSEIMGSIEFVRTVEDFMKWYDAHAAGGDLSLTPKVDGLACRKEYVGGVLTRAVTRGDGKVGKDVTENVIHSRRVVSELAGFVEGYLEERGEVFMTRATFEEHNAKLAEDDKAANPRNLAAGSLRLGDPKLCAERDLHMLAYDVRGYAVEGCKTEIEKAEKAKRMGIHYVPTALVKGTNKVGREKFKRVLEKTVELWEHTFRKRLEFDIDGIVFAINDLKVQKDAGWTTKSPRGKLAFKFSSEAATTPVEDVVWQVGRGGSVTPVAEFKPVQLMGTTVRRATLHNRANVVTKGVVPGSVITIEKRGDIIPGIVEDAPVVNRGEPFIPEYCPCCGSKLKDEGPKLVCKNIECKAQSHKRLRQFCLKTGLKGFGLHACETLAEGGIDDYAKLIKARLPEFREAGLKGKTAEDLVGKLVALKELQLDIFLSALSIKYLDTTTATNVAEAYVTLEAVLDASAPDMAARVKGVDKTARVIVEALARHRPRIEEFVKYVKVLPYERNSGNLDGKSVCITGTLSVGKAQWRTAIEEAGGKWATSVGARTDFLVVPYVGWESGKVSRASKLGVSIILEHQLRALIDGEDEASVLDK